MTFIDETLMEVGTRMSLGRFASLQIVISQTMVRLETKQVAECFIYRVIHKSLRDFRHLRYSSRDGHAEGGMSTEEETLQVSALSYRPSIYPPLVTRQMSIL
jgi:hypothetical protein